MLSKSAEPATTWTPPPWPTPWILFRIRLAPSSTVARKFSSVARLLAPWPGVDNGWKTSRVCPDTPPSTWQLTHFACTMGPEMRLRNRSIADSGADSNRSAPRRSNAIGRPRPPSTKAGHIEPTSARTGVEAYMVFFMRRCARARWSS